MYIIVLSCRILTILSSIFLFVGGVYNSGSVHMRFEVYDDGSYACYAPTKWPFIVGGMLSLFATGTTICFYIIATSNKSPINSLFGQNNNFNIQMPNANYNERAIPVAPAPGVVHGTNM